MLYLGKLGPLSPPPWGLTPSDVFAESDGVVSGGHGGLRGGFQVALVVKNQPANAGDVRCVFDPWVGKIPLEEDLATHSSILTWRSQWTEEPGRLQSTGLKRVGHD